MWTPDRAALEQLAQIFKGTFSSSLKQRQEASEALAEAKLQPQFESYLLALLVSEDTGIAANVRASAGIMLKNNIQRGKDVERSYVMDNIFHGLVSPHDLVRNITGNVITTLFSKYGVDKWPNSLEQLVKLASTDGEGAIGAAGALSKVCEDSATILDGTHGTLHNGSPVSASLVPQLILLTSAPKSQVRALALISITHFISISSQSILARVDEFLNRCFALATDSDPEVRRSVCIGFEGVLETVPEKIHPHLDGVIDYCLHSMNDTEDAVSMEACEFLLALASSSTDELYNEVFRPKMSQIVPILLEKMVYTEEEIFFIQAEDEREEEAKPTHAKSKEHKTGSSKREEIEDSDDDDDSDDSEDEDMLSDWSLRRCAANTLDVLSPNLPGEVLDIALPLLETKIVSDSWPVREAAILAFGVVSKSCLEMAPQALPDLIQFLIERMNDPQVRVRQISSWTLSRYSSFICENSQIFNHTFQALISHSLDPSRVVQHAVCSSLTTFIENCSQESIAPFASHLLELFSQCLMVYQKKSMEVLYYCIGAFVDKAGYELIAPRADQLLPILLDRWQSLADDDVALWPLFECMAGVAIVLQDKFAPYAIPTYKRATSILANCIALDEQCLTDPSIDAPEKDFMVTAIDFIDGLMEGFGSHAVELIEQCESELPLQQHLISLIPRCLEDESDDVRQSVYGLIGDMAINALPILKPMFTSIFLGVGHELASRSYSTFSVCTNALWSLGEIGMRIPLETISPHLENLLPLIISTLNQLDASQYVLENAATCLGKFGINFASVVATRLPEFIENWCKQVMYLDDNEEKASSFEGFLNLIQASPDAGLGGASTPYGIKNLSMVLTCIGYYQGAPQHLLDRFASIISSYRQLIGEELWTRVMGHIDSDTRSALGL